MKSKIAMLKNIWRSCVHTDPLSQIVWLVFEQNWLVAWIFLYLVSFLFPIHRHAAEVGKKTNKQDAVVCNYPLVFCYEGTTGVFCGKESSCTYGVARKNTKMSVSWKTKSMIVFLILSFTQSGEKNWPIVEISLF